MRRWRADAESSDRGGLVTATGTTTGTGVRDAVPSDNASLLRIAEGCTMTGEVAVRIDRSPDYFALNALDGDAWRVGVAVDERDDVVGCITVARRDAWLNGDQRTVCFVSDLKVDPRARGTGAADELTRYAAVAASELADPTVPMLATVPAGNASIARRVAGPRGTPALTCVAAINALSVPLLWERSHQIAGTEVLPARDSDIEPMAEAWQHFAARRQFAPCMDAETHRAWMDSAPGLTVDDYLVARDGRGRVRGFLGVWDQTPLRQSRVVSYSRRLAMARPTINAFASMTGGARLPSAGEPLPVLAAVHCCAPNPTVLRALVLAAYRRHRAGGHAIITLALDVRDPLVVAVRGLMAQRTLVNAYLTSPAGWSLMQVDGRPVHFETALA